MSQPSRIGTEPHHVTPDDADVGVFVIAPRATDVELERTTAADPPPERHGPRGPR
jgi:hypothetical protein